MNQESLIVMGRTFRNRMDYQAGKRDEDRINKIKEKTDFNKLSDVQLLLNHLEHDRYHFETLLGEDFFDEVVETEKKLKTTEKNNETEKKRRFYHDKDKTHHTKKEVPSALDSYDESMKQEIIKQLKKNERRRKFMICMLSFIAVFCIGYLGFYYFYYEKNNLDYERLADLKENDKAGSVKVNINFTEQKDMPPILEKYKTLYEKNKRLIGWLKIDDTNIDYPVMQTSNNEYYLTHNFNQEYDKNGSLFLDKDCNAAFPNDNMIIYGHHMKSGNMFGNLNYYSKESYYLKHPQVQFDTIFEEGIYDVMYVFRSKIYNEEEIVFKYYQFLDVSSADEFNSYMDEMEKLSLYDTGVKAYYGDKLITLSTCDSSEEDGRFVVVAKKVN